MTKPPAIVRFEQLYWASFVLTLIAKAMTWSTQTEMMQANPTIAAMPWLLPATLVVSVIIVVLLWFYTCRRPSLVAKWIVVVFAAIGGVGVAISLVMLALGRIAEIAPTIVSLLANAVYIAAAVLLFKPDAKAWFGEDDADDEIGQPVP